MRAEYFLSKSLASGHEDGVILDFRVWPHSENES